MDKFTKIQNKELTEDKIDKNILFENDWLKIKDIDSYVYLEESDNVCIIPFFIEQNRFFLRQEIVPSYKVKDNANFHLTCISGTIEKDENIEDCIKRELIEEAGISLKENYKVIVLDSLFKSKTCSSKFIYAILPISEYEYTTVPIKGDGSILEKKSKTIAVDVKNINRLQISDTITKLLIFELKKYLNI